MSKFSNKKTLGNFILLLTALIWGMSFVFQKEGVTTIEPFTFGAARCLLSTISVSIVALIAERKVKRPYAYKKNTIKGGIICGIFLTIACNLQQIGLVHTTAGKGAFITALYMLIIPLISFFFLKQKLGINMWIAVGIGVTGMYLLCMNEGFSLGEGDIYVIGAAFCFALQMLSVDRYVPMASPLWMSAIQFAINTVASGIIALIFEHPTWAGIMSVGREILYCGIMSGGAGYTLQMIGQGMTDPTSAGLLLSFESVFGAIGGALLLHEKMSIKELSGAIIMFIAIILVQMPSKNKNDSK